MKINLNALLGGFLESIIRSLGYTVFTRNYIPKIDSVQPNYIAPSQIQIKCEDLDKSDGRGLRETYIKVNGKFYGLKYNEGRPEIDGRD